MKKLLVLALLSAVSAPAQLDQVLKGMGGRRSGSSDVDDSKTSSGFKEALSIGTKNTVSRTGVADGYFRNEAIKILMPEKLKFVEKGLRVAGQGAAVDDFVLSMNRAAERAAPAAGGIFKDAISHMTFEDVKGLLTGGDTSVTQFFKNKTSGDLHKAFQPPIESAMRDTGVMQRYESMTKQFSSIPFVGGKVPGFDMTEYVTGKALDGLFFVLGEEERKIRHDPAAQITPLLREVFGKR